MTEGEAIIQKLERWRDNVERKRRGEIPGIPNDGLDYEIASAHHAVKLAQYALVDFRKREGAEAR